MYIAGIIAEYNPFHNGHLYHLQKTQELTSADLIIVVMSGSFVQRGEPAVINKWARTKMALEAGADLVIELPTVYSCSSAYGFAHGSVLTLKTAKANCFVCGAENTDLTTLHNIAQMSVNEPSDYKQLLHKNLAQGLAFAKAHTSAIISLIPKATDILLGSNNILAVNYLKALLKLNSDIKPYLVQRIGENYNSTNVNSSLASATAIRKVLPNLELVKPLMPSFSFDILTRSLSTEQPAISLHSYSDVLLALLRRAEISDICSYPEIETGMPELLINNARKHSNINDFIEACTSKRYQSSRIKRVLIRLLLNITKDIYNEALAVEKLPYLRILGMKKAKSTIIKKWRSRLSCDVIQRPAHYLPNTRFSKQLWSLDLRATDLYNLMLKSNLSHNRQDMSYPFVVY